LERLAGAYGTVRMAGKSWTRHRAPFPLNSRIQALVTHPTEPHTVFAAGDTGLFVSHNAGARGSASAPRDPCRRSGRSPSTRSIPRFCLPARVPLGFIGSRDGGRNWEKLAVDIAQECSIGVPFVTGVVVDPDDHRIVWVAVEIDGVFRSQDGGDTWAHLEAGLYDPDIHALAIATTQPKRVYASTAREMFVSENQGESWKPLGIKNKWPLPYARGIAVKADEPGVLFAGCGETTTGEKGFVLRSTDFGATWEILSLPTQANATIWGLATHPADGSRIVAFSLFGEVYVTEDAGASWRKIAREFGEIRAAVWMPN